MVIAKVQESRTSCASLVQVSPYVTFTDIPRIRTDDTATARVKWTQPTVYSTHHGEAMIRVWTYPTTRGQ